MSDWQGVPFIMNVKAGETKAFCMCGLSLSAPFCDGTHKSTDIRPEVVKFEADKRLRICGCKKSGELPYCDGSHNG
jgi:CDGSH-type Zn-finger protein